MTKMDGRKGMNEFEYKNIKYEARRRRKRRRRSRC